MKQIILIAVLFALCGIVWGDDDCCVCKCDRCGCKAHCHRVCHVVCEMKDVKKVCYCCKEIDVCIPGCSEKCGEECVPNPCCQVHPVNCEACAEQHHHSLLDNLLCCHHDECCERRTIWEPSCGGRIRGVNKLLKYEVNEKVPTYKWVVEYCCDHCCEHSAPDQLQPISEGHAASNSRTEEHQPEEHVSVVQDSAVPSMRGSNESTFLERMQLESQTARTNNLTSAAKSWNLSKE